ncbi:hypothetical protein MTR67_011598 [Solanum verrucosum]|uniref:Uncharacterized protein n=1 Tax=Solanum verrucosum TaxID=315347 RepID=A0AAF0Q8Q2_SOLVR|nr:hypothetical protein MTR67_011598 [Solanum verrucosum]
MGRRKDQCISEPEGSGKKKKSNRDFIKEHSTPVSYTRPTCSCATKAASDALEADGSWGEGMFSVTSVDKIAMLKIMKCIKFM